MADQNHIKILLQGVDAWNNWRTNHPEITTPDLSGADLRNMILNGINLSSANLYGAEMANSRLKGANLSRAKLERAKLNRAYLRKADLTGANLHKADLSKATLSKANLAGADLSKAVIRSGYLRQTILTGANLDRAFLEYAVLSEADIGKASLKGCHIYGISAWNLKGVPDTQSGLIITPKGLHAITVDDLQVAQFIFLLLNRENLRNVIDTITSKSVLILGRFTQERKIILDAMADELRKHNLLPIIFDFERPSNRDFTETIKTLAGMSLFIIADITNPKSSPLELQATVPDYQIPFVPIIQKGEKSFAMFSDLTGKYNWVLTPVTYASKEQLLSNFKAGILDRAWEKHKELQRRKIETIEAISIDEFSKSSNI